ncbi:MAG TPA: NUDIX hydrolase [Chloroflexia bacterium]|nr:NUDIX hydrolase [Chloroflexia bacterium]
MAIEPEKGLTKETVYDGKLFKVIKEKVRLANGSERPREIVVHPGAVALVVVDNDEKLILVRQYRRAADRVLLEIPAGTREPGEDSEACARRELVEETGYEAANVRHLGGFYSAPGFCTEFLECYLMTGLKEKKGMADDDENIEIERLSTDEALRAIERGEISDAKSICGILMWKNLVRDGRRTKDEGRKTIPISNF